MGKYLVLYRADTTTADQMNVSAGSLDEAANLLKDHPHFHVPGESSIEVLEFVALPGM